MTNHRRSCDLSAPQAGRVPNLVLAAIAVDVLASEHRSWVLSRSPDRSFDSAQPAVERTFHLVASDFVVVLVEAVVAGELLLPRESLDLTCLVLLLNAKVIIP